MFGFAMAARSIHAADCGWPCFAWLMEMKPSNMFYAMHLFEASFYSNYSIVFFHQMFIL